MREDSNTRRAADTATAQENAKNDNLNISSITPIKQQNTKLCRTMSALTVRSYNRFESAQLLHDHALHSTVSAIQNQYGVVVSRRDETVPGFQGAPTRVCRYWIENDQHDRVNALLGVTK